MRICFKSVQTDINKCIILSKNKYYNIIFVTMPERKRIEENEMVDKTADKAVTIAMETLLKIYYCMCR